MVSWMPQVTDALWRNAVAVIPLALLAAAVCRWVPCRASTKHAIWLLVLAWFVVPPVLPAVAPSSLNPVDSTSPDPKDARKTSLPTDAGQGEERVAVCIDRAPAKTESPNEPCPKSIRIADARFQAPTPPGTAARSEPIVPDRLKPAAAPAGRLSAPHEPAPLIEVPIPGDANLASTGFSRPAAAEKVDETTEALAPDLTEHTYEESRPGSLSNAPIIKDVTVAGTGIPADSAEQSAPRSFAAIQRWTVGLLSVRDAVGALPGIPAGVWLAGVGLMIVFTAFRTVRFVGRVRSARSAPTGVLRMVRQAARELGLRRVPETVMLDERVSPMIWCGLRVRLVLPTALWSQLDAVGRQAVVYHELAHLRRNDHWVRWIELLVTGLYWWHPLVWWVRRRLHEEADFCCDAWVTWLLPHRRRAYAEALLTTKQFISGSQVPVPAVGMGVATVRARRFARRLTMVMTQTMAPKLSLTGISMALVLMLAGWLATPARSCPPKSDETESTAPAAPEEPTPPAATFEPVPAVAPVVSFAEPVVDTYRAHMATRSLSRLPVGVLAVGQSNGPDGLEERLARLEKQNEELRARLDRLAEALEQVAGGRRPGNARGPRPDFPGPPSRPDRRERKPGPPRAEVPAGEVYSRNYELPQNKLEKLWDLMSRSDVPISVQRHPQSIEVHATRSQHQAFERFVNLIHPVLEQRSYELPEGKVEAVFGLMALDDVPNLVNREDGAIGLRATAPQQEIFLSFLRLVEPGVRPRPGVRIGTFSYMPPDARTGAGAMREDIHRATEEGRRAHEVAAQIAELNGQLREIERQAEEMERRAEEMEAQAEELSGRAEELAERAEDSENRDEAKALKAEARQLKRQSNEIRREAKRHMKEAEKLEREAGRMEEEIDRLEDSD